MRVQILKEIKSSLESNDLLWDEWSGHKFKGPDAGNTPVPEVNISNRFFVEIRNFVLFCTQPGLLQKHRLKLKGNYSECQDRLICGLQSVAICPAKVNEMSIESFHRVTQINLLVIKKGGKHIKTEPHSQLTDYSKI